MKLSTCVKVASVLLMIMSFYTAKADRMYMLNAPGYNTADQNLITAIEGLGHTVTVNSTELTTLPEGFTSTAIDAVNGYDWLLFFGDYDFSSLAIQTVAFVTNGGKVFYNYEVSCCTTASLSASVMVSAVTGLTITPNSNAYVALAGNVGAGYEAVIADCLTLYGNAYKPMDGLPLNNQLVATATVEGASPDISVALNFGFVFTGDDIPGNTLNGAILGVGDINHWYNGMEPTTVVNAATVEFFFPTENSLCRFDFTGNITQVVENSLATNISIYPSPASAVSNIHIKSGNTITGGILMVKDATGRTIEKSVVSGRNFNYQLNVSNYPSGLYFVQYGFNNEIICTEKFIVAH